jgi:ribosomal protein L34E
MVGRVSSKWSKMKNCPDHWIGLRGIVKLRPSNLKKEKEIHDGRVHRFNTAKKQIPHPGIWQIFDYCPDCGEKLDFN